MPFERYLVWIRSATELAHGATLFFNPDITPFESAQVQIQRGKKKE